MLVAKSLCKPYPSLLQEEDTKTHFVVLSPSDLNYSTKNVATNIFYSLVLLPYIKDKLEDMDLKLIKEGVRVVAIIFRTYLQPNHWTYITSLGTK